MRQSFTWLVIAVCVLGIYYPSIFSEGLSIDDQQMLQALFNTQRFDLLDLFWPSSSLYYYRPLIGLSFWGDYFLFGSQEAIVHLINILIHLANTLLLYRLLRTVVPSGKYEWPLLVAIFFGIHPLTTEPVNWISGRTDLLAGFFVLLSSVLFLENSKKRMVQDALAALCYLCGLWSKEVAIGLLPVVCFVVLQERNFSLRHHWRTIVRRVILFFAVTCFYVLMRTGGRIAQDTGILTAMQGGHGAEHFLLIDKLFSLIKAIGFYAQKILWPFPLNFAIVDINRPVAMVVGCVAIVGGLAAVIAFRRRKSLFGLVWMFCFLAPSLPVAINRMAWTPLAERYLYLPLMGLCVLLAVLLARIPKKTAAVAIMAALLFGWGIATAQRNIVWQTNLTLWQDVVEKSPDFTPGHNDYAIALIREGKKTEAQWHLARAVSLVKDKGKERVQMNYALQEESSLEQKVVRLDSILSNGDVTARTTTLQSMIRLINDTLARDPFDHGQRMVWARKLLSYEQQLAELDSNPYHTYRIGQLHQALGEKEAARTAFDQVCRTSNDYFTQPACTLAKRLAQETAGQ
ncbi:MAG: hypothetical protein LBD10_09315 [Desulfobulbus sp.]|jgi:hypothetical protein|uniref:hypothetical protein n=1 Tax=Desulfobulbus sp. TaxID=895 RepID=UPI002847883C|nr:hypothetical protein [Desulfobulbus sp.]MDR2550380.1 hypothetical protein [Desulfobulbus sp.]